MSSMIKDLLDPACLPDPTKKITLVQTHISLVFVADAFVYKVKKPMNFGFLDFSSLEKRKYYCYQEVELNRRLSEDIYLDVLPIVLQGDRHVLGGSGGDVVEYAVKMRRIPEDRLMKTLFEREQLTTRHLTDLASVLARFHKNALRTAEIDDFGKAESFRINTDENFEQVSKYVGLTIQEHEYDALKAWTNAFYQNHAPWFERRIREGRIRDCHGDLHMEHVCFGDRIHIIDCIEFNDRFRYSDTLADLGFLLMDLEYRGGKGFSKELWEAYKALSGEREVDGLLAFYKVYRAMVRGKVNSFQWDDATISRGKKQEAVQRAKAYFKLAHAYILEP